MIQVDARRLLCPMPVIRLQDAIEGLVVGDIVEITCTDPGVKNDIPAWCRINGHAIDQMTELSDEIVFRVRKQTGE
jgi:tRNA 2-thiouridine synthesizing protein A